MGIKEKNDCLNINHFFVLLLNLFVLWRENGLHLL